MQTFVRIIKFQTRFVKCQSSRCQSINPGIRANKECAIIFLSSKQRDIAQRCLHVVMLAQVAWLGRQAQHSQAWRPGVLADPLTPLQGQAEPASWTKPRLSSWDYSILILFGTLTGQHLNYHFLLRILWCTFKILIQDIEEKNVYGTLAQGYYFLVSKRTIRNMVLHFIGLWIMHLTLQLILILHIEIVR